MIESNTSDGLTELDAVIKEFLSLKGKADENVFEEYMNKLCTYKEKWITASKSHYICLIDHIIGYYSKFNKSRKAIEFIDEIYERYEQLNQNREQLKILNEAWAKFYVSENIEERALRRLEVAAFYQFADNCYYSGFEFFCFRSFTPYVWDDLNNSKITLVHPRHFNDPLDPLLLYWNKWVNEEETDEVQNKLRLLYQRVYDHIKVKCLVGTMQLPRGNNTDGKVKDIVDISPLMWSHYADYHRGFCIKYKFESDVVSFTDEKNCIYSRIANVKYREKMGSDEMSNLTSFNSLFYKYKGWEYEEEVRIVHYDPNCHSDFKEIPISPESIVELYLGVRCSDENRETIKCFLRDKAIKLYQMKIDPNDCYKLIKERIL